MKKQLLGSLLIGVLGGVCACTVESNEREPVAKTSQPLLGLNLGLPALFFYPGILGLPGLQLPAGRTLLADADIVTRDDDGGTPALSLFPRVIDLLLGSHRKMGAYPDPSKPPVTVQLRNGTTSTRPWMRYVEAKPGALVRKSLGSGADGSAVVPIGTTLSLVIVTYADVPASLSTLPTNVPGITPGVGRDAILNIWTCPGYRPIHDPNCDTYGQYISLYAGTTDYLFASANGMSFNADGSAADSNQYFMLNEEETAYDQVVFAGTAAAYSTQDHKYLQVSYGYASWTPMLSDSVPWFFTRP